jgi:predicted lipoprotein with Yx(FWY)xxD motif
MKSFSKLAVILISAITFVAAGSFMVYSADKVNVKFEKTALGNVLVDGKGMSLYYFKKDMKGKSSCAGDCLSKWPAFYLDKVVPGKGLKAVDFGMITREDGKMQTTYKGYPLYYFFQDQKAGDTKGDKFKDIWFVITPEFK